MFWKLFAVAATMFVLGVGSAAAAAPTKQGIRADGLRWQAKADFYGRQLGLKADGLRWQAMARAYQAKESAPTSGGGVSLGDAGLGLAGGAVLLGAGGVALVAVRRSRRAKLAL